MNQNTSIAITISLIIISISGCLGFEDYQCELTRREMEKTHQIQIQAKIDSIKAVNYCKNN